MGEVWVGGWVGGWVVGVGVVCVLGGGGERREAGQAGRQGQEADAS